MIFRESVINIDLPLYSETSVEVWKFFCEIIKSSLSSFIRINFQLIFSIRLFNVHVKVYQDILIMLWVFNFQKMNSIQMFYSICQPFFIGGNNKQPYTGGKYKWLWRYHHWAVHHTLELLYLSFLAACVISSLWGSELELVLSISCFL